MDRLALIGVSHRRGGAAALETWQNRFDGEALAGLGLSSFVPILTCNRCDLVLELPAGMTVEEARDRLAPPGQDARPYAYLGDGALEQLSRVASSLDSLNPGEDQIMAQVREAYKAARKRGTTGPLLSFTFDTALRIARRVRREVALAPLNTSLFSLARPELEALLQPGDAVAVIGAGVMGTLAAKTLAGLEGIRLFLANRTEARARQLARQLGAGALPLDAFLADPPRVRALVAATPVLHLLGADLLAASGAALVVDLGIPRNADPAAARALGVRVLDVDALQVAGQERRAELAEKLAQAEGIVREELDGAVADWTERQLGPSIRRLRDWYLETIGETIGETLPPEVAKRLAHKFAHVPIKGLRALARAHGLEAARTFLAETELIE